MAQELSNIISSSLIRYLGYGNFPYPKEDMARAIAVVDNDLRKYISEEIENIMIDANKLQPDWAVHDLFSGCNWIAERIGDKYKNLNSDALKAISWAFSYWRK